MSAGPSDRAGGSPRHSFAPGRRMTTRSVSGDWHVKVILTRSVQVCLAKHLPPIGH